MNFQLKTKERSHRTIREAHTVAVHVTGAWHDDFHHDSPPFPIRTGSGDHNPMT
jgi:hypothetical protein